MDRLYLIEVDLSIPFVPGRRGGMGPVQPEPDTTFDQKTPTQLAREKYGDGRHFADALVCGFPFSFDPVRQKLLCFREPDDRARIFAKSQKPIGEAVQAFLSLKLKYGPLTDDEDRQIIIEFVKEHGAFIPFQSVQDSPFGGVYVTIADIKKAWADARGWKWLNVGAKTGNREWAALTTDELSAGCKIIAAPYRQMRAQEGDSFPLIATPLYKTARFVSFFEAFAIWHEVAVKINDAIHSPRDPDDAHADDAVADALKTMRVACMQADQESVTGGKVVRFERTQTAKQGAEGAAALVDHLEREIALLDLNYRESLARAAMAECRGIDHKIMREKERAAGAGSPEVLTRKGYAEDVPFVERLTDEQKRLWEAAIASMGIRPETRRDMDKIKKIFGPTSQETIRTDDTQRHAYADLRKRERAEKEVVRLEAIRSEVRGTLDVMKQDDPRAAQLLELVYVEGVTETPAQSRMGLTEKSYRTLRTQAMAKFCKLCALETLEPFLPKVPKKRGTKRGVKTGS
ncbi:MAG: hypothetical protein ACYCYO_08425 [Bacilli bacterium]